MTDLEITRLCAEAMGLLQFESTDIREREWLYIRQASYPGIRYDPLHDDAQAMALVRKIGLDIHCRSDLNGWYVGRGRLHEGLFTNADLNRAICECVANMQQAKEPPK